MSDENRPTRMVSVRLPPSALEALEQHRLLHGLPTRTAAIVDLLLAGMEARTPRGDALIEAMRAAVVSAIGCAEARAELATPADVVRGAWLATVAHSLRAHRDEPEETYADVIPIHTH